MGDSKTRSRRGAGTARVLILPILILLILLPAILPVVASSALADLPPAAAVGLGVAALDHPTRARILAHLEAIPGDHFRSIVRSIRVSVGETRHHLNVLMRRGRVREQRVEGRCRYYVNGEEITDRNSVFEAYWTLQGCRLRVLSVVRERQVVRPSDVAADLGISRQLADYHLQRLAASGQVRHEGGRYRP